MEISKKTNYKYLKYGYLLALVPIFFLIRYYYLNDPGSSAGEGFFPSCPFHSLTGYHCPGCGSQRAIHDLLNGRILHALQHNLLFVILAIVLFIKLYNYTAKRFLNKKVEDWTYNKYFTYIILISIISYWILRNVSSAPFCHLAP
ncbi:DUF2752 domain-containing protein [Aquimarina sp. MMG015]|uniref:DUF2752 domain-containing protein n=1 Tax=Aquimarina TaxID=290174 RepID=UPI00055764FA|nr:DUF2752 domain-containing protein [Aquimarina sp. AD1]MBQ4804497.1 DUF2752 domain-containing protein [Aquimarina sp. MMG015]RKN11769.1 DUF2752 domain-containing protein [Aquimarina sp. AD1]